MLNITPAKHQHASIVTVSMLASLQGVNDLIKIRSLLHVWKTAALHIYREIQATPTAFLTSPLSIPSIYALCSTQSYCHQDMAKDTASIFTSQRCRDQEQPHGSSIGPEKLALCGCMFCLLRK